MLRIELSELESLPKFLLLDTATMVEVLNHLDALIYQLDLNSSRIKDTSNLVRSVF